MRFVKKQIIIVSHTYTVVELEFNFWENFFGKLILIEKK